MRYVVMVTLFAMAPSVVHAADASAPRVSLITEPLASTAEVSSSALRAPIGSFVLIRTGAKRCAIKIIDIWRDDIDRPTSAFSSGGYTYFASYESYYRDDGRNELVTAGVRKRSGILKSGPSHGLGRMVVPRTTARPPCGGIRVTWMTPTWISFYPDKDLELAATWIRDVSSVDFVSTSLQWYRDDPTREPVLLMPR